MVIDRYVKGLLTVIAIALVAIAARPWVPESWLVQAARPGSAYAQAPNLLPIPKYEVTVPRSWGKFISFSNNNLLLEGPDQSLRVVDVEGRAPEYPKLKTIVHWQ
jgi:hypothetical protein